MIKNKIDVIKDRDYTLTNIMKECSFSEYLDELKKYENYTKEIPIKMLILDSNNFIHSKILKQKIFCFENYGFEYIISMSNNRIKISQSNIKDNNIYETTLEIEPTNFHVTNYIHDLNYRTRVCKGYDNNIDNRELELDKKEALSLAQQLLEKLKNMNTLYKMINIYYIYRKLNLLPNTWYNPILSDDVITLSSARYSSINTINGVKNCTLDIILNDTREQVGNITFNLKKDNFTYDGNVGYQIKEKFQNNGYATRALKLLKEIVKTNEYVGDKDLFISTTPDNIFSQKVAENNSGDLIYNGEVPENDAFNYKYGVKEVKVYQIRMNREQITN